MSNYAVIDVGSNSIRLVVYSVPNDHKRAYARDDFARIANDKVMAGLAAYVEDGVFSKAGIKKASSSLKTLLRHASYFKCKKTGIFATAVLRNATNSAEAIAAIEEAVECKIDLITGTDEALLGFAGACCDMPIANGVMIDIGGGSCELTRVVNCNAVECQSIPQGSLSSYADCVKGVIPTESELAAIRDSFKLKMADAINIEDYRSTEMYGIGGSVRATAKMLALNNEDRSRPSKMTREDVESVLESCILDASAYAHKAVTAAPERIHTLTPGCMILSSVMSELGGKTVNVCKCGIREGYLIKRMLNGEVIRWCE